MHFNGQTPCYLHFTLDSAAPEQPVQNSEDLLPREPCLQALAALRHAKWFQVCFPILSALHLQNKHKKQLQYNL